MKKDHITQFYEALRNIEKTADALGLPDTVLLAGDAAKKLEDYKASAGQFILKLPPHPGKQL